MGDVQKTPVTMLSGFLGSGKTTLLRYVLENSTEKIACIVNDVASINIDAKLVRNDRNRAASRGEGVNTTADLTDTIELANGCACCNLQDELFASFEQVLALADRRGEPFNRIVLENSGVAEPQNIRDKFVEAGAAGHPLMARVALDTLVTLVDSGTFIQDYASRAPLAARPELGEGGNLRPVVDLLVEQVECADFIILNKIDQLPDEEQLGQLTAIVSSLNPLATVIPAEQGRISIPRVFGSTVHTVVAKLNTEGQHRGAVAAALTLHQVAAAAEAEAAVAAAAANAHDHDHSGHGHNHSEHDDDHSGHDHDHSGHGEAHDPASCATCHSGEEGATDGHAHAHGHEAHEHEHEHGHDHGAAAAGGAAAGVDHDAKRRADSRAALRFGIRSFVYSQRRPFHPQRLRQMVLRWLPVATNKALEGEEPGLGDSPIKSVLRSKGFMWMSNSHATAYFWSHAGSHFEIRDEGDWWAVVPDEDWPQDSAQRDVILQDFDLSAGYGDRRQEIVFIGANMEQALICNQLDSALLTDEEMLKYDSKWGKSKDPQHADVERLCKRLKASSDPPAPAAAP